MLPVKGGKWLTEMSVGAHLLNYDSLLALTHFKGHTVGGFGGSNKNLGIGCADGRIGKKMIHQREGSDNMWSIAEEELMERFVRGDSARTSEGSGLGLSIARSLTELQGGSFAITIDCDLFKAELRFRIVGKPIQGV